MYVCVYISLSLYIYIYMHTPLSLSFSVYRRLLSLSLSPSLYVRTCYNKLITSCQSYCYTRPNAGPELYLQRMPDASNNCSS